MTLVIYYNGMGIEDIPSDPDYLGRKRRTLGHVYPSGGNSVGLTAAGFQRNNLRMEAVFLCPDVR